MEGEKHGKGSYQFNNGLRYEGDYFRGKKEGQGTLFNCDESIAYVGEFSDDVPHGEGFVYDERGNKLRRKWVRGVNAQLIL